MILTSPTPPAPPTMTPPTPPTPQAFANANAASGASSGTSGGTSSGTGKTSTTAPPQFDYLKLIVAQMSSMNPFDPSSGSNSLPEMMQAEQLSEMTKLEQSMQSMQTSMDVNTGASLLGRSVQALNSAGGTVTGSVRSVQTGPAGVALLLSSGDTVRMQDVQSVSAG